MYKKYKCYDKTFKESAVKYYIKHKELSSRACAELLNIDKSSLLKWYKEYKNGGIIMKIKLLTKDSEKQIRELRKVHTLEEISQITGWSINIISKATKGVKPAPRRYSKKDIENIKNLYIKNFRVRNKIQLIHEKTGFPIGTIQKYTKGIRKNLRIVIQVDPETMKVIKEYSNPELAAKTLSIEPYRIYNALANRVKTTSGYKFYYKYEYCKINTL